MNSTPLSGHLTRAAAAVVLVVAASTLTACTGTSEAERAAASESAQTSPFSSDLDGPTEAQPGETITVVLRNLGRLPDAYQVLVVPTGAAVLKENDYRLGPGESIEIDIEVKATPFDVQLKNLGGGGREVVALTVR